MAFMDKPTNPNPEDMTEMDSVVALQEDGDVEKENAEHSGVVSFIQTQFNRSKDARLLDETRWLTSDRKSVV